jgi:hypothetical protein
MTYNCLEGRSVETTCIPCDNITRLIIICRFSFVLLLVCPFLVFHKWISTGRVFRSWSHERAKEKFRWRVECLTVVNWTLEKITKPKKRNVIFSFLFGTGHIGGRCFLVGSDLIYKCLAVYTTWSLRQHIVRGGQYSLAARPTCCVLSSLCVIM